MEGSMIDLSKYRFQSAKENLETAQWLMKDGRFKASVESLLLCYFSRSSSLRQLWQNLIPVNIREVIAFFNRTYVKEGAFDKSISKLVDTAYRLREKALSKMVVLFSHAISTYRSRKKICLNSFFKKDIIWQTNILFYVFYARL